MTATHDIAALCAAIDQGDDSALPIICHGWQRGYGHAHSIGADAPALESHPNIFRWGDWRLCDYRSDAFLALAEALAAE